MTLASKHAALALVLALACWAPVGHAQELDAETRTMARDLARQGADAFDQADYATALDRLNRAYSLYHAPTIALMQARALARLGRLLEALDRYEETLRMPVGNDAPEAFRIAVSDAKREGEDLRARIPRLLIRVRSARGIPEGLSVLLDGKPVPAALLNVERPIDMGAHEVTATAPGYHSVTKSAMLGERGSITLDIDLDEIAMGTAPPAFAPAAAKPAAEQPSPKSAMRPRVLGWTFIGVAAAGLATSAITGVIALGEKSELDDVCKPTGCPPSSERDIDSFRAMRTISYVSLVVGVASLGVGSYFLLSGSRESAHVAATIGPTSAGIQGVF
jgi:hypothetical protein